jgi:hypothetical protein
MPKCIARFVLSRFSVDDDVTMGEILMQTADKRERPILHSATVQQQRQRAQAAGPSDAPTQLQAFVNSSSRMLAQGKMLQSMFGGTAQLAAGEKVAQCTLMSLDAFEGRFANDKERQSSGSEFHIQICYDLRDYHKLEYDLSKDLMHEIEVKHGARKLLLESIVGDCDRWLHFPVGKRPTAGNTIPWDTVQNLKNDAVAEYAKYYASGHEGKVALRADLEMRARAKKLEPYSASEFKKDAQLGMFAANMGDTGAIVTRLKAFHAVKETPYDDSTRAEKLGHLDAMAALAATAKLALQERQKRADYKSSNLESWKQEHNARLLALDRLIDMVKSTRGRYLDPTIWKVDLLDAKDRSERAAQGEGVEMSDDDAGWVDVDDSGPSKELEAETNEILKRLAPDAEKA